MSAAIAIFPEKIRKLLRKLKPYQLPPLKEDDVNGFIEQLFSPDLDYAAFLRLRTFLHSDREENCWLRFLWDQINFSNVSPPTTEPSSGLKLMILKAMKRVTDPNILELKRFFEGWELDVFLGS